MILEGLQNFGGGGVFELPKPPRRYATGKCGTVAGGLRTSSEYRVERWKKKDQA